EADASRRTTPGPTRRSAPGRATGALDWATRGAERSAANVPASAAASRRGVIMTCIMRKPAAPDENPSKKVDGRILGGQYGPALFAWWAKHGVLPRRSPYEALSRSRPRPHGSRAGHRRQAPGHAARRAAAELQLDAGPVHLLFG